MTALSEKDILNIWEMGQRLHLVQTALVILKYAFPEESEDTLACLSKGARDMLLLNVRVKTFGNRLDGLVNCISCNEQLEISIPAKNIMADNIASHQGKDQIITFRRYQIFYRLPNSYDMAEIVKAVDEKDAVQKLILRCVIKATRNEKKVNLKKLPEYILNKIEEHMADHDLLALIELDVKCNQCGYRSNIDFDIVPFLWAEICTAANRLFYEIHLLARYYGWSENHVLSMTAQRRKKYIEMMA